MDIKDEREALITLISPTDLFITTQIYSNTEKTQFKPIILLAQETYVQVSLGQELYDSLMIEWVNSGQNPRQLPDGTTNANGVDYKTLYQKIKPYLIWQSYTQSITSIAIKIGEKGVYQISNNDAENVDIKTLTMLEMRGATNAKRYGDILDQYIKDKFKNNNLGLADDAKSSQLPSSSFHFPNRWQGYR